MEYTYKIVTYFGIHNDHDLDFIDTSLQNNWKVHFSLGCLFAYLLLMVVVEC